MSKDLEQLARELIKILIDTNKSGCYFGSEEYVEDFLIDGNIDMFNFAKHVNQMLIDRSIEELSAIGKYNDGSIASGTDIDKRIAQLKAEKEEMK